MAFDASIRGGLDVAVERSAAPAEVWRVLDQLRGEQPDLDERLADNAVAAAALVSVLAASRSMQRLLVRSPTSLDVLFALDRRVPRADTTVEELVAWKHDELLRIAARDLIGLDRLEATGAALADLAADVLHGACLLAATDDAPQGEVDEVMLAVVGMGKLGGRELNYSSDIDILFVGDGPAAVLERRARAVVGIAARCYRVDTGLRPLGRDGPLVRSLDSYEAYWDRWAAPWEFQALLRARAVAGDPRLGRQFADTARRWLWTRPFSADDLRSLRQMKHRAEQEVARQGLSDREIKRGRGGIRDIEFTVQLLQLVHGPGDLELRSPSTLVVLGELATAGYVDPTDSERLADSFRFLRRLEDRLQLQEEQQVHTVPDGVDDLDRLARVLGYRGSGSASATERFQRDLRHHQLAVRSIHERVYFRPLLEAFASTTTTLSPEAAVTRLTAFGFTDAHRTRLAVQELTRGLNRSSRLMQHLLPLLLDWLSGSPDPDLGLLLLRNLLAGSSRRTPLMETFRDSPDAAQRLCTILGTSRLLGDIVIRNPDLVAALAAPAQPSATSRHELVERAAMTVSWRADLAEQTTALQRWKERHLLTIAARDVLDQADVATVGHDLTVLAEATLENALSSLDPQVAFAVIALGRFGGAELSYASDLDVMFVHEGGKGALAEANRLASGLLRLIGGATPASRIYAIDAQLRPEGKGGALVRSIDGYVSYWERYALVWERQAMLRARPVAGDAGLGQHLIERVSSWIARRGLSDEDAREIRRMKARIERERIPLGEDPQFHLKLGRGSLSDVEFTAQLLQLRHGIESVGTIPALEALAAAGALANADAQRLADSYEFCERARNRWYLVDSRASDALPSDPAPLQWLARSLDLTPTELREHYRRVTRRARRVTERVFYDQA